MNKIRFDETCVINGRNFKCSTNVIKDATHKIRLFFNPGSDTIDIDVIENGGAMVYSGNARIKEFMHTHNTAVASNQKMLWIDMDGVEWLGKPVRMMITNNRISLFHDGRYVDVTQDAVVPAAINEILRYDQTMSPRFMNIRIGYVVNKIDGGMDEVGAVQTIDMQLKTNGYHDHIIRTGEKISMLAYYTNVFGVGRKSVQDLLKQHLTKKGTLDPNVETLIIQWITTK